MAKFIFVTGGVVSGLGKGITAKQKKRKNYCKNNFHKMVYNKLKR